MLATSHSRRFCPVESRVGRHTRHRKSVLLGLMPGSPSSVSTRWWSFHVAHSSAKLFRSLAPLPPATRVGAGTPCHPQTGPSRCPAHPYALTTALRRKETAPPCQPLRFPRAPARLRQPHAAGPTLLVGGRALCAYLSAGGAGAGGAAALPRSGQQEEGALQQPKPSGVHHL